MTTFLTRRKPFLLALLLSTAAFCSWADAGHDHGDAPVAASSTAKPRFTATSEAFELVGVVNGKNITLYLDHAADNRPVKDAKLELELGGAKVAIQPHGEGEFEATLAAQLQPGVISVTATIIAGQETDLLAGELEIGADTHADASVSSQVWKKYGIGLVVGLLALAGLFWGLRRMRAPRNNRVGGTA
jgi:hypothetical protein